MLFQIPEETRAFLWYWLWAVPSIGLACVAWTVFEPSAFQHCPQALFVFPLLGSTAAGWTWFRTFDHRYLPQLLYSALLLVVGAWFYWTLT